MHRVITTQRQARDDDLRRALRYQGSRRQCEAHDAVIHLRVERVVIERDAGAAGAALGDAVAEALDEVGMAAAAGVAQRDEEATGWQLVHMPVGVVLPAP